MIWLKFAFAQLVQFIAAFAGLLVLIPFCLAHAWTAGGEPKLRGPDNYRLLQVFSIKDGRPIDIWKWRRLNLLNRVYGNPEDGVSGLYALVRGDQRYIPYFYVNPVLNWLHLAWCAYCWSALRNSCDNLKYVFAVPGAPLKQWSFRLGKWAVSGKMGYQMENGYNVPVFSPLSISK